MNLPIEIKDISILKKLEHIDLNDTNVVSLASNGAVTDGVSVGAYGQGQCSGVTYTVPAHGQIDVDFEIKLQCITPAGIESMNMLVESLLDASKQHEYKEMSKKSVSGGISFLPFFGSAKASAEQTKETMDSWGLSEESQGKIVDAMLKLSNEMNTFKYKGTVYNKDYDYSVSGNMFAIVMDCKIEKDETSSQQRYIGPDAHLSGSGGEALPATGKLY